MQEMIERIKQQFEEAMKNVTTPLELEEIDHRFFSRKSGLLTDLMKSLKDMGDTERREAGQKANALKEELTRLFLAKKHTLTSAGSSTHLVVENIDVTQPALSPKPMGHLHPMTRARWELEDVALSMGFLVEDGPELESDYFVFEALNIPPHHPARDAQDTFYIKDHPTWAMRSHVSNMQVRLMRKYNQEGTKAVRAVYPGKCFRNEATDAKHEHTFYQFESLMVDRDINIGHLVGVIQSLLQGLYKRDVEVRLRPSYFPFVEPGFELDMKYIDKHGKEQWMEMLGCGLMHPHVVAAAGYDPKEWRGFAFGMGLDRLVLLKHGIEDIRHFHSGDLRFLNQF